MTVLVLASRYDLHADAVVHNLQDPTQCIRIDPDESIDVCCDSEAAVSFLNGSQVDISNISGVYCRYALELSPSGGSSDPVANYRDAESLGALRGILLSIPADRWMNFPWYENAADGKIQPIRIAKQLGFSVPAFIVTNDLAQLDLWRIDHGDNLIIKPITDTSIAQQRGRFVNVPDYSAFSAPYTARFERRALNPYNVDSTPFLIQKMIEKVHERRVVVIDDAIYATQTSVETSSPLDIRLKGDRIETVSSLSDKDQQAVIALRNRLNLRFMTIDFAVDVDGVSWLLDVNPSGNWLWQEQQLSLGICSHIVSSLLEISTNQ